MGARGGHTAGCESGTLSWKESRDWGSLWNREEGMGLGPVPELRSRAGWESGPRSSRGCRGSGVMPFNSSSLSVQEGKGGLRRRVARDLSARLLLRPRGGSEDTHPGRTGATAAS